MRLEVEFVGEKEDEECRDRDITSDERAPIKWVLKDSKSLNEQQEDVEGEIESVNPDAAKCLEWEGVDINVLLLRGRPNPQMDEDDAGPGNVGRSPSHGCHVREDLTGGQFAVHEGQKPPKIRGQNGHIGHCTSRSARMSQLIRPK